MVHVEIGTQHWVFANVYGLNTDDVHFFEHLFAEFDAFRGTSPFVIGGDFNIPLDMEIDKFSQAQKPSCSHEQSRDFSLQWIEMNQALDPWRVFHPNARKYTWFTHSPCISMSCIDYFLVPEALFVHVTKTLIECGFHSDHSVVSLMIALLDSPHFASHWRFPNVLLQDHVLETVIVAAVKNASWDSRTTARDKWDNIKIQIQNDVKHFQGQKQWADKKLIESIEAGLAHLHYLRLEASSPEAKAQFSFKILEKNEELLQIYDLLAKKKILQGHHIFYESYEHNTKFFHSKVHPVSQVSFAKVLYLENGLTADTPAEILHQQTQYFSKLYTTRGFAFEDNSEFLHKFHDTCVLSEKEKTVLAKEFMIDTLFQSLKHMKKGKSPGPDGLTVEFYLHFWNILKKPFFDAFLESCQFQELSFSMRQGLIQLIPKKVALNILTNWRPISLLNVDYKVISCAFNNKMQMFLDELIHSDQRGFVPGRNIAENIMDAITLIDFIERHQLSVIMLQLDFQKAFDSLEWAPIQSAMKHFNFPVMLRELFVTLHSKFCSHIIGEEALSPLFSIQRGVLQGVPASPTLFVLTIELLSAALHHNDKIVGVILADCVKLSASLQMMEICI